MNKAAPDTKVKKTLLRNYEIKVKQSNNHIVHDVACSSNSTQIFRSSEKENELNQPSLCSSEAIANYLADIKKAVPLPLSSEDLNSNKAKISAKVTKKLNFPFKDSIYKNLIELNCNIEELKHRKEKRTSSTTLSIKKDLEPNIEDFYEEENEIDSPPSIPVLKRKFKPIKKVEDGRLHKLVLSFEHI